MRSDCARGPLLDHQQLAAVKSCSGSFRSTMYRREPFRAVQILMQAVGSRPLTFPSSSGVGRRWSADDTARCTRDAKQDTRARFDSTSPVVGDRRQARIEIAAQLPQPRRQRIGEVAILALAEVVPRHLNVQAEHFGPVVEGSDVPARRRQEIAQNCSPFSVTSVATLFQLNAASG